MVESLVAITVLVLAVTGVTSAIQTGISSYIFSKNQIIAFYLAQEGFEQIRNMRDENALNNNRPWLTGIADAGGDPCYFGFACYVNPIVSNIAYRCGLPGSCPVLQQDASGFFGYALAGGVNTIFTREITLTQIATDANGPSEISILVTVSWSKGTNPKQFKARENLLNWQ